MNKQKSLRFWLGMFVVSIAALVIFKPAFADAGPLSIGARAVDFIPADSSAEWLGGVQARLRLPLFFGVEGSADYRREAFGATTVHQWPIQLSGLLYLPKIILVQPFLLGGVGWYNTTVKGPNYSNTQNQFGPHVGAGVEFNLSSSWFLDATYRYIWLDKLHAVDAQGVGEDVRDSGHMITAGINYRL